VFTSDDDFKVTLKMYKSLLKKLKDEYKKKCSQACVYYESSVKEHIYLDKENSWQGEYPIRDTQKSIKLSVGQEGSFAVLLSIQPRPRMQNGIESSSEANNYELLLGENTNYGGENKHYGNTFWKLPGPIGADYDYDYLLCQFVATLRKTELMKKIRVIMEA